MLNTILHFLELWQHITYLDLSFLALHSFSAAKHWKIGNVFTSLAINIRTNYCFSNQTHQQHICWWEDSLIHRARSAIRSIVGKAASAHVKYSTAAFLKSLVSMFPCQYVEKFNICYHVTAAAGYRCLVSQHQHFPLPSFNKIILRSPAQGGGGRGPQHWQRCMQWSTWIHSGYSGG